MSKSLTANWNVKFSGPALRFTYGNLRSVSAKAYKEEKNFHVKEVNTLTNIMVKTHGQIGTYKVMLFTLSDYKIFFVSDVIMAKENPDTEGIILETNVQVPITPDMGYFALAYGRSQFSDLSTYAYNEGEGDFAVTYTVEPGGQIAKIGDEVVPMAVAENQPPRFAIKLDFEEEVGADEYVVTEKYQIENGQEIQSETITTIEAGQNYNKIAPELANYEYLGYLLDDGELQVLDLVFIECVTQNQEVIFVYRLKDDNDNNNGGNEGEDNMNDNKCNDKDFENCQCRCFNAFFNIEKVKIGKIINKCCCGSSRSNSSSQDTTPIGSVIYYTATEAPAGWLICDGAEVSRSEYTDLFDVVGTTFGEGDGANTFNLPDLRGEFIRGIDLERGIDSSRELGSCQKGSIAIIDPTESIIVNMGLYNNDGNSDDEAIQKAGFDKLNDYSNYTGLGIATEIVDRAVDFNYGGMQCAGATRPRNVALLPCIKY